MKLLLQYLKAFGVSWLTAMSGVFSVPFVALMTAFAGIWTAFNGDRGTKSKPVPGPHQVHGFLTASPNSVVDPIPSQGDAGAAGVA